MMMQEEFQMEISMRIMNLKAKTTHTYFIHIYINISIYKYN